MICQSFTESGKPCHFDGCESYRLALAALTAVQLRYGDLELETARIRSDRDRLAGVVKGMEEQNARNLDALRRAEAENARLREALVALRKTITTAHVDMGGHHRYGIRNGAPTINAVMMADNALKEVGDALFRR